MARLLVLYKTPKDPAAFDKYYFETHVPIANKIPGFTKYEVSHGPVVSPMGDTGLHMIATIEFPDMATLQAAFASPEGQAAAADVATFAGQSGFQLLISENREV
jgi:uncharacterized protein (TIGR02118 family)